MEPSNTKLVLVKGGVEIDIEYQDGGKETVKVRQLPIRHMEKYLVCFDDEAKALELFCDKPAGWADTLAPVSHNDLIEKCQELNHPLFEGWYRRRMERTEILSPGVTAKLREMVGSIART